MGKAKTRKAKTRPFTPSGVEGQPKLRLLDSALDSARAEREFTPAERKFIARHDTPEKVQRWLKTLTYNYEKDGVPTLRSFRRVLRDGLAHCLEGALAAATILREHGFTPLLVCMEARDVDHNVFIYQRKGKWGAIGQSRDPHLRDRKPSHKTLRDLVLAYYPYYWNLRTMDETDLSLRGFARVDLRRVPGNWATAEEDVFFVENYLYDLTYEALWPKPRRKFYVSTREEKLIWK